ncbi:MAG: CsbD family protein [Sphingomonas bacterium]|jgi:uncharacterized protein YjbJ (UPF0337 family)|nr:CsbD family protein [Sphingomonas bacterium]
MNSDTFEGEGRNLGGKVKEVTGDVTGDRSLQNRGVADQVSGNLQSAVGSARDAIGPLADQVKGFARQRPYAAAALAGVVGIAILNTLRGRR